MTFEESLSQAHEIIAKSVSITVLTGAGVSAESGIPTYRDPDGLWSKFRSEDFSSVASFERDPKLVWEWYHERRRLMGQAEPNPAHHALTKMEGKVLRFQLLTQNIDGLHQRAGTINVTELHGSVWNLRCTKCHFAWGTSPQTWPLPAVPECLECKSLARPDVVWFGESLNKANWEHAVAATQCDTMIVVGTSAQVQPVAGLIDMAVNKGARLIVVNAETIPHSDVATVNLIGSAAEILPKLVESVDLAGHHELDLGKAFQRGLEKFYTKYPDLRPK